MGVLRPKQTPAIVKLTEEITYADYIFDDSGDEHEVEEEVTVTVSAPTTPARRRQKVKSGRWRNIVGLLDDQPARSTNKVVSGRKLRRMENARLLSSLIDPDDICEDLSDMLPAAVTAFTKLFIEQDKMKAWNEFVEKDEEDQRAFLEKNRKKCASTSGGHLLGGRGAGTTPKKTKREGDSRSEHPAYSGEACFRRMDARFRSVLNSRHLPWGALTWMEREMTEFFTTMPDGVYVQHLESGVERLLLHGVAQYLSLESKSISGPDAKRATHGENRKPYFIPPRQTLVDYLTERRGGKDQF